MPSSKLGPAQPATVNMKGVGEPDRSKFATRKRKPAGDYLADVIRVEQGQDDEGNIMWVYLLRLAHDAGATYNLWFKPEVDTSLPYLRQFIVSCGRPVPDKRVKIDPNNYVKKRLGITLEDDEYNGREQSRIVWTMPAADVDEDASNAPAARPSRAARDGAGPRKGARTRQAAPVSEELDVDDSELDELDIGDDDDDLDVL
ncbi:MAG: hypothetical protein LC778_10185 [Acidobacteria bacterium]|nr:hypothetical protein [Acidobacteriota bacterium]